MIIFDFFVSLTVSGSSIKFKSVESCP